jgi:hypothetical protein
MAKQLMNEAERYLLEHWQQARLLEQSMEGVRAKYKELFQRIIDQVTEAHPELNASKAYPTQFWGQGEIGFGRKSWPSHENKGHSGFWMSELRIELLSEEESEAPYAYIWAPKKSNLDFNAARVVVEKAAKDLLTPDELKLTSPGSDEFLLFLSGPSKRELLGALSDGDGEAFVKLFVSQFDLMSRFTPTVDKVFRDCLMKT